MECLGDWGGEAKLGQHKALGTPESQRGGLAGAGRRRVQQGGGDEPAEASLPENRAFRGNRKLERGQQRQTMFSFSGLPCVWFRRRGLCTPLAEEEIGRKREKKCTTEEECSPRESLPADRLCLHLMPFLSGFPQPEGRLGDPVSCSQRVSSLARSRHSVGAFV